MKATIDNVEDTLEIARELNITIILNSGSLLGAYRDGGLIKGDEDDVDFAVSYEVAEFKLLETMKKFVERGFQIKRLRPTVLSAERDGSHIDFLFYKKWDDNYYYETLYHKKRPFALLVPKECWDKLSTIDFLGFKIKCPKNIEKFLEWRYGDWKTPIPRENFSFDNLINKGITKWLR